MKKYNKGFIPLIIGIVIAIIIAGGITYGVTAKHRSDERAAQLNAEQNGSLSATEADGNKASITQDGGNVRIQNGNSVLNVSADGIPSTQTNTSIKTNSNVNSSATTTTTFKGTDENGQTGTISNQGDHSSSITDPSGQRLNFGY